ncbi:MAG TPA: CBS domain-containing protein [Pirellulaceae bacterium]|nr:CBS domain-containing protein [Pirellulaceae bacterium]
MTTSALGTLITYNPWTVAPASSLEEVANGFASLGVHHVAVVDDDRRLVGIVSETDLLRARQGCALVAVGGPGDDRLELPALVVDVMSRGVRAISAHTTQHEALRLLVENRFHALPVADGERLIGMITSRDFLREFSYGDLPASRDLIVVRLAAAPQTVESDTTLEEALLAMHETGSACLAVVTGGLPLGVVSQRDIVRARLRADENGAAGSSPTRATVSQIVRSSPVIRPGQRLCDAAAAMIEHELPAVTVVNQASRLLGVITEDDILQVMYDGSR